MTRKSNIRWIRVKNRFIAKEKLLFSLTKEHHVNLSLQVMCFKISHTGVPLGAGGDFS